MTQLACLALFAGLSLNALLQFGMGIRNLVVVQTADIRSAVVPTLSIFMAGLGSWVVFSFLLAPLGLGFFQPLILYPLTVLLCFLPEALWARLFPHFSTEDGPKNTSLYGGASFVSSFLILRLAVRFSEALVLSIGMALGYLGALWLLTEIRKRSDIESVPRFLRGTPLVLISAGLLSLISFAAASVILAVLSMG